MASALSHIVYRTCRVLLQLLINNTAKLHHVGFLYILTYDARKLKRKIVQTYSYVCCDVSGAGLDSTYDIHNIK